jgi:hypothetical protein
MDKISDSVSVTEFLANNRELIKFIQELGLHVKIAETPSLETSEAPFGISRLSDALVPLCLTVLSGVILLCHFVK